MPSPPTVRWNAFAIYSLLGFVLSAIVNALSYVGIAAQEAVPAVWLLHVGIFPAFGYAVLRTRHWRKPNARWSNQIEWSRLRPYFPAWVYPVGIVLGLYVFLNFFLATRHLPQRGHQSPIPMPAHDIAVYTVRAFSGHWLIFYFLPAVFFLFVPLSADSQE